MGFGPGGPCRAAHNHLRQHTLLRLKAIKGAEEGVQQTFEDVDALARDCGFTDCTHAGEPRCAVVAAVADGRLAADRLEGWLRLRAEPEPPGYEALRGAVDERKRRKATRRAGRRTARP